MASDHSRSRKLRKLADEIIANVPEEFLTSPRSELSLSLMRQWLTYENHATLLFPPQQHYLRPNFTVGKKAGFDLHLVPLDTWLAQMMRQWDFGEDLLRKHYDQTPHPK